MESAAHIEPQARLERQARRQYGAARRQPERLHHLPGIRNLQAQNILITECPGPQLRNPLWVVHQQDILVRRRLRRREILFRREPRVDQPVVQHRYFFEGKTWLPRCKSYCSW